MTDRRNHGPVAATTGALDTPSAAFGHWQGTPLERVTLSVAVLHHSGAAALSALAAELSGVDEPWELIVGSGTAGASGLAWANLTVVDGDDVARRCVLAARGDVVLVTDAGHAPSADEVTRMIAEIRAGAHLAVGTGGRRAQRRPASGTLRRAALLGGGRLRDARGGPLLLRGEVARALGRRLRTGAEAAGLELLYLAARDDLRTSEVPVARMSAPDAAATGHLAVLRELRRIHRRHARRPGEPAPGGMHLAVVSAFPPGTGDLNEYGLHLARVLAEKDEVAQVTVLADRLPAARAAQAIADAPNVRRVWAPGDALNAVHVLRALRRARPDAVIFNLQRTSFGRRGVPAALGLLIPMLARLAGVPAVTLLHDPVETGGGLLTRALLASTLVAVTTPRAVKLLRDHHGARNVFLAPHGTLNLPGLPAPLPLLPTVVATGTFGTNQRLELLLHAHELLLDRNPRVRLVIAGTDAPAAPGYLDTLRREYAHLPNVSFGGAVAGDAPGEFAGATVVAFPHATGGFAGVMRRAGAAGRAAVLPRLGTLADLLEEGYRAETFTPDDPHSLADALWRVLNDPRHAAALGEMNWRVAVGLPLADIADWYLLHLEELVARPAAPASTGPAAGGAAHGSL